MRRVDQRAHVQVLDARADAQRGDLVRQRGDQRIGGRIAHAHGHRDRHAALAGRAVAGAEQRLGGQAEVGIGQHHRVVLGATQRLHALAAGAAALVQVAGHRRGPDEAQRLHARVVQQRIDRLAAAMDDVEHAVGQPGFLQQRGQVQCRGGHLLRWLEHEAVAAGQRHRCHPQRDHHREVERRDAGDHAQRRALAPAVHASPHLRRVLALEQVRNAAGELHHFQAAGDFAARVGQGLAVLGGDRPGQRVGIALDQRPQPEHHPRTLQRRRRRPVGKRRLRRGHGRLHVIGARQRHARADLAAGGVEYIAVPGAVAGLFAAADMVLELSGHRCWSLRSRAPLL